MFPLLASTLLTVSNPHTITDQQGDVFGDGTYKLPAALVGGMERSLDLRELQAENNEGNLRIVLTMGGLDNPWSAPRGFSVPLLDVFIKTGSGGVEDLGGTGFHTPPGNGWQYRYQVSGFRTRAWQATQNDQIKELSVLPKISTAGSQIILDTDLSARHYSYWATVRIYSPLSPEGYLTPRIGNSDMALIAPHPGMPSAVDILFTGNRPQVYLDRILPPSGELRDSRPKILLGIAIGALLITLVSTFMVWRRTDS